MGSNLCPLENHRLCCEAVPAPTVRRRGNTGSAGEPCQKPPVWQSFLPTQGLADGGMLCTLRCCLLLIEFSLSGVLGLVLKCVCVYARMCSCMHSFVHMHGCTCVYVFVHCVYKCACACTCVCARVFTLHIHPERSDSHLGETSADRSGDWSVTSARSRTMTYK